jgi:hypothetical protein
MQYNLPGIDGFRSMQECSGTLLQKQNHIGEQRNITNGSKGSQHITTESRRFYFTFLKKAITKID